MSSHNLKSLYDRANKNRIPPKEPPVTTYRLSAEEIAKRYPKG